MKYDTHMHSKYSKDSFNEPSMILRAAKKAGLNGIAVTDHNSIKGGLVTHKLNKDKDFEVIVGEEIMTDYGELLAYYIQDEIPKGLPILDAIDRIRSQGGLISVAHPFSRGIFRKAFTHDLNKLRCKIDAIEGWNARMITQRSNKYAQQIAKENNFAVTGGSDAHFLREIGRGYVEFDGSFEKALKTKKTTSDGKVSNAFWYRLWTLKNIIVKKF